MDTGQLEAFVLLAQTKSFTRTANQLHIAQSTVTTRIKALEEQLGKALFNRDNRSVELTAVGQKFLPYAKRVLELLKEGEKAALTEGQFEGHVAIGSLHSLWDYVLFPIIEDFHRHYPAISLRLISGHSDDIIRKMADGIVDVGLVYLPPKDPDIEVVPLLTHTICLVAHPSIEMNQPSIGVQDLVDYPYIHVNWGNPFTEWYHSELDGIRLHPLQVDHTSLLLKFIAAKKGMGFLLTSVANELIQKGELIKVPLHSKSNIPERTTYLIYSKRKKHSPSFHTWVNFALQYSNLGQG